MPVTHEVPIYKDVPVPVMIPEPEYNSDENMIENVRTITVRLGSSSSSSSESHESCSNCKSKMLRKRYGFAERKRKLDQAALWY